MPDGPKLGLLPCLLIQLALFAESMVKCIALDAYTVDDTGVCRVQLKTLYKGHTYTSSLVVSKIRCMASRCSMANYLLEPSPTCTDCMLSDESIVMN